MSRIDDFAAFMAVDLPNPETVADSLEVLEPYTARTLLAAYRTANGWRIPRDAQDGGVRRLRTLGLVEVPGSTPSPSSVAQGRGYYLGAFGTKVLLALRKRPGRR